MPIRVRTIGEEGVVLSQHCGAVSDEEMLSTYRELFSGQEVLRESDFLVDLRKADSRSRSSDGIRQMAKASDLAPERGTKRKIAIVVNNDLSFGLARMYQAYAEQACQEVNILYSLDEALPWLGCEAEPLFSEAKSWLAEN
ncbi:hypothetical protein BVY04_04950 [bacterium M21]|nr:hypothetical protein BVY04_04950 [bacterium M21]